MGNKQLLENMSRLGYPLLDAGGDFDVYETLTQVVVSDERRYWEGFPVLLANVAKEGAFDYVKAEGYLKNAREREKLKDMFLLSLAMYDLYKLKFKWAKTFFSHLADSEKNKMQGYKDALTHNSELKVGGDRLHAERMKNAFQSYFTQEAAETRELGEKRGGLSLEFAFSHVFSPKQKELFNKKLRGEPLTKTEREYFSRVVRKKVSALANTELHQLARKVLEL